MSESRAETQRRRDAAAPWPKARLGEVCEIYDCPHTTAPDEGEGYALVRTPNVGKGRLIFDKMHRVSREVYDRRNKRAVPRAGDIIFAREAPAGNAALITEGQQVCLGQRTVLLRPNNDIADSAFLTYCIISPKVQERLLGISHGSTVSHVNMPDIVNLEVPMPPLPTQHAIAQKLSRYDELIENNTRRIAILENKAQMLYKEWFVRKRGIGNVTFTAVPLFEVANISYGYPFHSDQFCADDTLNAVVRIRDIQDNDTATFTPEECDDKYLIEKNAILVGMDGLFHMCLWNGRRAYLNQRVAKITTRTTSFCNYLLFQALAPHIEYLEKTITGTTVAHLGDKHLRKVRIEIPDEKSRSRMNQPFERLMELKWNLQRQNALLAKERDLLLPRLMSGRMKP